MTSSSGPALLFDEAGRVGAGNGGMEVELLLCPKGEPGEKEEGESSFSVEMARSMLDLILARSVCARPMERSFRFKSLISSEVFSSSGVVVGGLTSPDKSMRLPCSAVTRMRRGSEDTCPDEAVVFSWIEWPDKAAYQAMAARMDELMKTDGLYRRLVERQLVRD